MTTQLDRDQWRKWLRLYLLRTMIRTQYRDLYIMAGGGSSCIL